MSGHSRPGLRCPRLARALRCLACKAASTFDPFKWVATLFIGQLSACGSVWPNLDRRATSHLCAASRHLVLYIVGFCVWGRRRIRRMRQRRRPPKDRFRLIRAQFAASHSLGRLFQVSRCLEFAATSNIERCLRPRKVCV